MLSRTSMLVWEVLSLLRTNTPNNHSTTTGPETKSPSPAEGLSSSARKRRQELEYEEEDEAPPVVENLLQAEVNIPNIPVPKSSDGQVRPYSHRSHELLTNFDVD